MKKLFKQTKKPLNKTFLLVSFLSLSGIILFSFLQAWNIETQLNRVNEFSLFFAEFYDVLRFPFQPIFGSVVDQSTGGGVFFYFLFLILNAALYSVVIERFYNLTKMKKRR